jgi:entericidin B
MRIAPPLGWQSREHRAGYRTAHKGIEMKKLIALLALGCAVLAGCNTMAGMGKDLQTGGQKLENAADNTKQKM